MTLQNLIPHQHTIRVWGNHACFSEPALHTERHSYPLITPSAARGVFEAIFWKPEFAWKVTEIAVVKRGTRSSLFRNEISTRQVERSFSSDKDNFIDVDKHRAQRHSSILDGVEYLITAQIVATAHPQKYSDMFVQRASRGKCAWQPYLGCREFSAYFEHVEQSDKSSIQLDNWSADLGYILLDIKHSNDKKKLATGAEFFQAEIKEGVLKIEQTPQWLLNKQAQVA